MYDLITRDFDKVFGNFLEGFPVHRSNGHQQAYRLSEDEGGFYLSVNLPGIPRDKINVEVKDGYLHVSGEVLADEAFDKVERHFNKKWKLGNQVDSEGISARMEYGVLYLTLPKSSSTKPKKIPITYD